MLCSEDIALWEASTKDVTLLGEPKASERPSSIYVAPKAPDANEVDLHGLTVEQAYRAARAFLEAAMANHRSVIVITGLSGEIKREFPFWLEQNPAISSFEELNGGGAFRVRFKRSQDHGNTLRHHRRTD